MMCKSGTPEVDEVTMRIQARRPNALVTWGVFRVENT
jgi:hypothetical protein